MNGSEVVAYAGRYPVSFENDCAPVSVAISQTVSVPEFEDDCAPAYWINPPKSPNKINTVVQLAPQLYTDRLPHNFTLVYSSLAPAGPAVLNPQAMARLEHFRTPQPLQEAVDYTLAEANILLPVNEIPQVGHRQQPTTLTAWLHVTNACNLDCPYCYIRKSSARMSDEVGLNAINATFQAAENNGFRAVKLKYAGGEAALHFKLVQRLHTYAQQFARKKELQLQAVVLSNGTLWTPAMAHWLVESGVKLMISLDGVGQAHDKQRPTRSGRGSFAKIERTVDNILLPVGVRPDISITITGRNAAAAADAVAWAIERDLSFSLNFYRGNLLSAKYDDLKLEETQIIEGMRSAYQIIEKKLPTRPFLGGLLDRVQVEAHMHTCGVGQNYLIFTHTGRVAQCQMHLENGASITDKDDALQIVAQGLIPAINVDDKEGCRDCIWRYRCAGGCPLETYRATGRFDVQSPHCNIYTTLFPEALRLEGLRLMKVEGYLRIED